MLRRLISLLASAALLAAPLAPARAWIAQGGGAGATPSTFLLLGKSISAVSVTGDRYTSISYSSATSLTVAKTTVFPIAGFLTSLRFSTPTAPTGTQTWTATLYKNGSSTLQTCTITSSSSPAGLCTSTQEIAIAAGDYVDLLVHPANSPNSTIVTSSSIFLPTTPNDTMMTGSGTAFSTSAVTAAIPFALGTTAAAASRRSAVIPDGGVFDKLQVISTAPGTASSTKQYDFTVAQNTTPLSVTCNIFETATTCSDGTHSASVSALDDIAIQASPTNTPTASTASFAWRYRPTTTGSFGLYSVGLNNPDDTNLIDYLPVGGGNGTVTSTETNAQNITDSMTITKIAVKVSVAPGLAASGKQRVFSLRVNGSASVPALSCTVFENATTCSASATVSVNNNDKIAFSDDPTTGSSYPGALPAVASPAITILAHR